MKVEDNHNPTTKLKDIVKYLQQNEPRHKSVTLFTKIFIRKQNQKPKFNNNKKIEIDRFLFHIGRLRLSTSYASGHTNDLERYSVLADQQYKEEESWRKIAFL